MHCRRGWNIDEWGVHTHGLSVQSRAGGGGGGGGVLRVKSTQVSENARERVGCQPKHAQSAPQDHGTLTLCGVFGWTLLWCSPPLQAWVTGNWLEPTRDPYHASTSSSQRTESVVLGLCSPALRTQRSVCGLRQMPGPARAPASCRLWLGTAGRSQVCAARTTTSSVAAGMAAAASGGLHLGGNRRCTRGMSQW